MLIGSPFTSRTANPERPGCSVCAECVTASPKYPSGSDGDGEISAFAPDVSKNEIAALLSTGYANCEAPAEIPVPESA